VIAAVVPTACSPACGPGGPINPGRAMGTCTPLTPFGLWLTQRAPSTATRPSVRESPFAPRTPSGLPALPKSAPGALRVERPSSHDEDLLDPAYRRRAALMPPPALSTPTAFSTAPERFAGPPTPETAHAAGSLEDLMRPLVRRLAWSGDGRRATARIEIGAGELAGATLLVDVDEGRVRVHLDLPPGVVAGEWRARICRRLADRRIPTDRVEVT
jgi:hypothetical protein